MIIKAETFPSIELARQAAIAAAEERDRMEGFPCLTYRVEVGEGMDHVKGLYSNPAGGFVWLHAGIEIK